MTDEEDQLPNYYAILQVHPQAEADVIRAAYRLLVRKYHPDSLPPDQRQDMEVLMRVRLINLAYDILSDPTQRAAFDAALKMQAEKPSVLSKPGLEMRIHLVRCARTEKTYNMLLVRRAGSSGLFKVTGFEPVEAAAQGSHNHPRDEAPLALPDGKGKANILRNLWERIGSHPSKSAIPVGPPPHFPTQSDLQDLVDTSTTINFGEINWAGFDCPACHATFLLPNGRGATWCRCSRCARIYCAGKLRTTPIGVYTFCPWCGRLAKITRTIDPGEQVDMQVSGEVGRTMGELPKLKKIKRPRLPDKGNG